MIVLFVLVVYYLHKTHHEYFIFYNVCIENVSQTTFSHHKKSKTSSYCFHIFFINIS